MKKAKNGNKKVPIPIEAKVKGLVENLIQVITSGKPRQVGEIVLAYGELGYCIGAALGGYKEKGPTLDELNKAYYTNPSLSSALMLQGLTVKSWIEDIRKEDQLKKSKEETK